MLLNTEGMVIHWQSGALTGCHVLLPTAQKCDISSLLSHCDSKLLSNTFISAYWERLKLKVIYM